MTIGNEFSDHGFEKRNYLNLAGSKLRNCAIGPELVIDPEFSSVPGEVSTDPARPPHTAAHGVWRYLGKGRFGVTIWDLFYDVNTAQPLRYNKLRLELTLADDRDSASATAIVETIDLQGVVVGSRTGSANFVRILFQPLE